MTPDPELLRSLETILAADPENHPVRLHLAELLAQAAASAMHSRSAPSCSVASRATLGRWPRSAGVRLGAGVLRGLDPH